MKLLVGTTTFEVDDKTGRVVITDAAGASSMTTLTTLENYVRRVNALRNTHRTSQGALERSLALLPAKETVTDRLLELRDKTDGAVEKQLYTVAINAVNGAR